MVNKILNKVNLILNNQNLAINLRKRSAGSDIFKNHFDSLRRRKRKSPRGQPISFNYVHIKTKCILWQIFLINMQFKRSIYMCVYVCICWAKFRSISTHSSAHQ